MMLSDANDATDATDANAKDGDTASSSGSLTLLCKHVAVLKNSCHTVSER